MLGCFACGSFVSLVWRWVLVLFARGGLFVLLVISCLLKICGFLLIVLIMAMYLCAFKLLFVMVILGAGCVLSFVACLL